MIVLDQQKIIALKARKVGGTSFEIALSRYANAKSIITPISSADEETRKALGFFGPQNFRYSLREARQIGKRKLLQALIERQMPIKYWNHINAEEARMKLGEHVWNNHTKIAIIRNPFDYMVSLYFWRVNERKRTILTFEKFCLTSPELLLWNKKTYEIDGNNVIDYMIRYDRLPQDILALERQIPGLKGLASTFSKLNAKGDRRPGWASTREMFRHAPRSHALISNICHDDIVKYGFETP